MQSVQSNNPALRNSPFAQEQYADFRAAPSGTSGQAPAGYPPPPAHNAPYPTHTRPDTYARPPISRRMTLDDVVVRTAIALVILVGAAAASWVVNEAIFYWAFLPALVLGLVIAIKQITNPVAILAYAALQGVFLGTVSRWFESIYPGVVIQAVIGTFGVFAAMLVLYRSGRFRMTARMQKVVILSIFGVIGVGLFNMFYVLFTGTSSVFYDGGPIAIIFSLVVIAIASFSLLADFDMIDRAIESGVDEKFAWYAVFGLMVTLIWLYLEILRLMSYLRN